MGPLLAQIGISWESGWNVAYHGVMEATATTVEEHIYIGRCKFLMNITVKIFEVFFTASFQ